MTYGVNVLTTEYTLAVTANDVTATAVFAATVTAVASGNITDATAVGRAVMRAADASAARVAIERQDFAARAALVSWASGRTVSTGLVMRAAGVDHRYIGSGTAISDMPGWVTNTPYYKSRAELIAATVNDDVSYVWAKDRLYVRDTSGTAITSNSAAVKWSPAINASPVDWGGVADASDNTTALAAWASWLATAAQGLEGFLPSGEWKSTAPIVFSGVRSRVIRGVGGNIIGKGSRLSYTGTAGNASRGSVTVLSCLHYAFEYICFINRAVAAPYHVVVSANADPDLSSHFIKFRLCSFIDGGGASVAIGGILLSSSKFVELDGCSVAYNADYGIICGEDDDSTIISGQLAFSTIKNCLINNDVGIYRATNLRFEANNFDVKATGGTGCVVPLGSLRSSNIVLLSNSFNDDGARTETRAAITTSAYAGTVTLAAGNAWIIDGNVFRDRKVGIHVKGGCRISANAFMQRSYVSASVGIRLDAGCTAADNIQIDPSNDFSMSILNGMTPVEDNRAVIAGDVRVFSTRAMAVAYAAANRVPVGSVISAQGVRSRFIGYVTTIIADMPGWVPDGGVAHLEHYADNTAPGTTDMTAAWQAACANNRVVKGLPGSTYLIKGVGVVSRDGSLIDFEGCTIIATGWDVGDAVPAYPTGLVSVQGTLGRAGLMTGSAAAGATTITLASPYTAVEAGDGLYMIGAGTTWYTEGATVVPKSFVTTVLSRSGATVTLAEPLPFGFDSGVGNVTVSTWKGLKGVTVRMGVMIGPGYVRARANGAGENAVTAIYCRDLTMTAQHIEGFQGHSIYAQRSVGVIQDGHIQGWPDNYTPVLVEGDNAFFGGFWAIECSKVQQRGTAGRVRHATDGTRSRDVRVSVKAWDTHQSPYTVHWGCDEYVLDGFNYRGLPSTQGVVLWRGASVRLSNVTLESIDTSPAFYDGVGAVGDIGRSYTFDNATLISVGAPLVINAITDSLKVASSTITGGGAAGTPAINLATPVLKDLDLTGNTINAVLSNYAIDHNSSPTTARNWRIKNNNINGYVLRAGRVYAETGETMLDFAGNMLRPSGTPSDHFTTTGTFKHLILGPNLCADGKIHAPMTAWTPVVSDGTNNATAGAQNQGWYRREGMLVHFWARVQISAIGSVSGPTRVTGLPFACNSLLVQASAAFAVSSAGSLAITAGQSVTGFMASSASHITMQLFSATTGTGSMTQAHWGSAGSIIISGSYPVA